MIAFDDLSPGPDGLVPAVVQDVSTKAVSMVAYMNEEALQRTQETGFVHFWSRSRSRLWKKGETSGNTLAVKWIRPDCDGDALLVAVDPAGPVCHTGASTCFGDIGDATLGAIVDRLCGIIAERHGSDPDRSYTARLIADPDLAARKVLEEAGEVAFAVKDLPLGDTERVVEEAADVVYHLLALLEASGTDPARVGAELRSRMG